MDAPAIINFPLKWNTSNATLRKRLRCSLSPVFVRALTIYSESPNLLTLLIPIFQGGVLSPGFTPTFPPVRKQDRAVAAGRDSIDRGFAAKRKKGNNIGSNITVDAMKRWKRTTPPPPPGFCHCVICFFFFFLPPQQLFGGLGVSLHRIGDLPAVRVSVALQR